MNVIKKRKKEKIWEKVERFSSWKLGKISPGGCGLPTLTSPFTRDSLQIKRSSMVKWLMWFWKISYDFSFYNLFFFFSLPLCLSLPLNLSSSLSYLLFYLDALIYLFLISPPLKTSFFTQSLFTWFNSQLRVSRFFFFSFYVTMK